MIMQLIFRLNILFLVVTLASSSALNCSRSTNNDCIRNSSLQKKKHFGSNKSTVNYLKHYKDVVLNVYVLLPMWEELCGNFPCDFLPNLVHWERLRLFPAKQHEGLCGYLSSNSSVISSNMIDHKHKKKNNQYFQFPNWKKSYQSQIAIQITPNQSLKTIFVFFCFLYLDNPSSR